MADRSDSGLTPRGSELRFEAMLLEAAPLGRLANSLNKPSPSKTLLTTFSSLRLTYLQAAQVETISMAGQPRAAHISEDALVRAAQQGDADAFEQLVCLHDRIVLRVALNILRSPEDARDAYQEIFLKAYRSLGKFRFQCSFRTWLYRIGTNVCLDQLRRKSVRKERTVAADEDTPGGDVLLNAPDERPHSNPTACWLGVRRAAAFNTPSNNFRPRNAWSLN